MRFHNGAVPEDPAFQPEEQGWKPIREPGVWGMQLMAIPVAFLLVLISAGLIWPALPDGFFTSGFHFDLPLWKLALTLIVIIPVHEFIHALCSPGWGCTRRTVIGMWLSRGLFYAHYEGEMSRNRFLFVFAGPYLVLALLPIPAVAILGALNPGSGAIWPLAFLSLLAGTLSSGDAIGFFLVLMQIPADALVRNKGWRTYWRPPDAA